MLPTSSNIYEVNIMAEKILNTRIQLKYDTWENWSKTDVAGKGGNLVLKAGEVAITAIKTGDSVKQTTPPTVMFKVGDGTSKFSELPWASALAADVYAWAKAANKPTYTAAEVGAATTADITDAISKIPTTVDTDTQYQLVLSGHTLKLQSKAKGATTWTDVSGQSFTLPDNNTTYSFAEGETNGAFTVTPSGGTATSVKIHGLGSAAYTASDDYDAAGAASAVQSTLLGTSSDAAGANTIYGANKAASAASTAAATAQSTANGKYSKPSTGIPKSDLAEAVQTSLDRADSAIQSHQTVKLETGTNNGTVKLTVGGTATDNIAVKGLAALAYKASLGKGDVGLGSVVNAGQDSTPTAGSSNYVTSGGVKSYVDSAISGVTQFKYEVVSSLPTASASTMGKIYLVAHTHSSTDGYDEYITLESGSTTKSYSWEKIGNTDIDLSSYVNTVSGTANSGVVTNITKSGNTVTVTSASLATGSPSASGTTTSFIDTISQAANGKITATKKTVPSATQSAAGLMSAADKTKLDGVASGATNVTDSTVSGWGYIKSYTDTNQKIKAKSGTTDVTFGNNDIVEFAAGSNVTITPDATNKKITIASSYTDTGVTSVSVTGSGNAVTAASISGRALTLTKGATFLTSHQDISGKQDKLTAGSHISISGNTISAAWPSASDSGYAGINKTGTVTSVAASTGLKITGTASTTPTVAIDDSVVFVLNGGSSTENV